VGFAKLDYHYQQWVTSTDEDGNQTGGSWANQSFDYLRVEFPPVQMQAPMSMPGQAQFMAPQGVTMNPTMQPC
jgi:hypothetical protein